jgi:hypothetical protein
MTMGRKKSMIGRKKHKDDDIVVVTFFASKEGQKKTMTLL